MRLREIICLLLLCSVVCFGRLRLATVFSDNMVLQQKSAAPIWGWSEPYQKISIKGSWMALPQNTRADENGRWQTNIKTPRPGEEYSIIVQAGSEFIKLNNILSGEVWLCSGQSNMHFPLKRSQKGSQTVAESNIDGIRLFKVPYNIAKSPAEEMPETSWKLSSPETSADFSAIGFYYAKLLHEQLNVPVGIIQASCGGTLAESWMRKEVLSSDKEFLPILERFNKKVEQYPQKLEKYQEKLSEWQKAEKKDSPKPKEPVLRDKNSPSSLYNGMIAPLIPYKIKGVIWYQGEANRKRGMQYKKLFPALIENWRVDWNHGPFPFYFVQIAPYKYEGEDERLLAELWEAQLHTMKTVLNTGMVVTTDLADIDDIHPKNKYPVAQRLFLWAMAKNYGEKGIVYSGPIYKSMAVEGDKIRILFDHIGQGLKTPRFEEIEGFTIAAEGGKFYPAEAIIERNTVVVNSVYVDEPAAVRYGWSKTAQPNLINRQGLPASPFRTDDRPAVSADRK